MVADSTVSAPWMRSSSISSSAGFALKSCLFFCLLALTCSWCPDTFLQLWSCSFEFSICQVFWEQWNCWDKASPAVSCDTALQQKLSPSSSENQSEMNLLVLIQSFQTSCTLQFILLQLELAIRFIPQPVTVSLPKSFTHPLWEEAFFNSSYSFPLWKFYKAC